MIVQTVVRSVLVHVYGVEARGVCVGGRRRGQCKTKLRRMIEEERPDIGWQSWATVRALAANRSRCIENVKALCALWHGEM